MTVNILTTLEAFFFVSFLMLGHEKVHPMVNNSGQFWSCSHERSDHLMMNKILGIFRSYEKHIITSLETVEKYKYLQKRKYQHILHPNDTNPLDF